MLSLSTFHLNPICLVSHLFASPPHLEPLGLVLSSFEFFMRPFQLLYYSVAQN